MAENFWPTNLLADLPSLTPLTVLNEQAAGLTERTGRLLEGVVVTTPAGSQLQYQFLIHSPVLGVRVPVLQVTGGPASPLVMVDGKYVGRSRECRSLDELNNLLKEVFNSPDLVQTVRRLVAESRVKGLPFFLVEDNEHVGEAATLDGAKERALRRIRRDDIIDIYELATGRKVGTVEQVGKDKPTFSPCDPNQSPQASTVAASTSGESAPVTANPAVDNNDATNLQDPATGSATPVALG